MTSRKILYLSREDVERVNLPMSEIIVALEAMFREKGEGRTQMPPKPGVFFENSSFIHAMPAAIPASKAVGMKWVSGFPQNQKRGLPYISGLIVLNDIETGIPLCVMDCTWVTAQRTGAATAVAAKYLARRDSRTVGILGCGVQGFSNIEALQCLFDLQTVLAYDIVPEATERYKKKVEKELGIAVKIVASPEPAVRDSHIVVTAGPILKDPDPAIENDWFCPGSFACPVDYDSYWQSQVFRNVDKLYTDDIAQLDAHRKVGYFGGVPENIRDLGDLVAGKSTGRENDDERTMSINLGLALDDMATAPLIYNKALELNLGTELDL